MANVGLIDEEPRYRMVCSSKCKYCAFSEHSKVRVCVYKPARYDVVSGEKFYVGKTAGEPCDLFADTVKEY